MKKASLFAAAVFMGAVAFSAQAKETLSIGATPVPHAEILEFVKPILAKQGIELKIVEFNDYVQPNLATSDKDIDGNFFQHRPYLDSFIAEHGVKLKEVVGVHIEPMGVYSKTLKSLKDIKDGAKVAIPNDPTNGGRALLLLQSAGLITLEDPKSIVATPLDVKDNPLHLDIRELEAPQLPRSLDEVAFAIINTNYAIQADLNPLKDAIYIEKSDSPYVNILVGNEESVSKPAMEALKKVLTSEETKDFINKKYDGAVVPAF